MTALNLKISALLFIHMNINNIHKPKIICASTLADHIDPAKGVKRVGGEGGGGGSTGYSTPYPTIL